MTDPFTIFGTPIMAGRLHAPVELAIVKPLAPGLLEVSIASSNPATADHFYYLLAQN